MSSPPLKIYIVEDEVYAIEALGDALKQTDGVEIIGHADNVQDAYDGIIEFAPDAVFLDIKLRGGDAFHLLQKCIENEVDIPPVIIMTGHAEFEFAQKALNEYRDHIIKILRKPFWENFEPHFQECREAIHVFKSTSGENESPTSDDLYIRQGNITYRLTSNDIDFIEVGGSGTIIIVTSDGEMLHINQTLTSFLESAPREIIRIHRNNAIHRKKISHVDHEERLLYLKGHKRGLDIGRTYYPIVLNMMKR